jgi:arylsulfatase A
VLDALDAHGYGQNTMTWLSTDNGPEVNCPAEGFCTQQHYRTGPGSAGILRGRKRDVWEGGHRTPGVISWPAVVQGDKGRVSWEMAVTHDFLPTIMDVLNVTRPAAQAGWGVDGRSLLPLLTSPAPKVPQTQSVYRDGSHVMAVHGMGWMYNNWNAEAPSAHLVYRYGRWKYVHRSKSCTHADCEAPMLFDLATDLSYADAPTAPFQTLP